MDFIWQPAMINSVVRPWRGSKALPKAKLARKKGHGHCLAVCCPSDPLQCSGSWQDHYIWEICSANWWDAPKTAVPAAGIGQQNGPSSPQQCPTAHHTTSTSKVEWIGLWSFASSAIFTWPLANRLLLLQALQLFVGKILPHQQEAENASQEFITSQSMNFYATEINLCLTGKNVLIVMVPILINKDVFKPSYNDLKFTIQNHNYSFTNNI